MKKINVATVFIGAFFVITAFALAKNRSQLKLEPGLYIISNEQGSEFELNHTRKFYDFKTTPFIGIQHITSTAIGVTPIINGKKYPTLSLNLDSIGVDSINSIKDEAEIGLILNNKLRSVAKYVSFGVLTGTSIKLQGSTDNNPDGFNELKKDIDAAH